MHFLLQTLFSPDLDFTSKKKKIPTVYTHWQKKKLRRTIQLKKNGATDKDEHLSEEEILPTNHREYVNRKSSNTVLNGILAQ